MILIVGADGNMGHRYKAVLDYIGLPYTGVDINSSILETIYQAKDCEGIIIATPTDTHYYILQKLYETKIDTPVLCEKPLTRDIQQLHEITQVFAKQIPLTMVLQYHFADRLPGMVTYTESEVVYGTYYNYFKHGNDGLKWDCIQIIGLSDGNGLIEETSPIWDCIINGERIDYSDMDEAYVKMIRHWRGNPGWNYRDLYDMHLKVLMVSENEKRINWYSSTK